MAEPNHIDKMITSCDLSGIKLTPAQILQFQEYSDLTRLKSRLMNAAIVILIIAITSIVIFAFLKGVDGAMKLSHTLSSFLLAGLGWVGGQLFERKKASGR